jgi:hypothetical protein
LQSYITISTGASVAFNSPCPAKEDDAKEERKHVQKVSTIEERQIQSSELINVHWVRSHKRSMLR